MCSKRIFNTLMEIIVITFSDIVMVFTMFFAYHLRMLMVMGVHFHHRPCGRGVSMTTWPVLI